jgi:hypothetical protein
VDRCALFVDAGYVLANGAMAVHGTRNRESVSWDYAGVLQFLGSVARDRTGLPLLRCYWYEATAEGRRTAEHETLADLPGVKLRLGSARPHRRDGVEGEIRRDLTVLARNGAITDALVVSAEEDLAQVIADVQDLGMRVTILHILVGRNWTISRSLRQECDDIVEIGEAHLRPYVELVVGAEPVPEDDRAAIGAYAGRAPANGHGAVGGLGNQQALPVGASANAPSIYTTPVVAEYQRSVQPVTANGRPAPQPPPPSADQMIGAVRGGRGSPEHEPVSAQAPSAAPEAGELPTAGLRAPGSEPGVAESGGVTSLEQGAGPEQPATRAAASQAALAGPGMPPQQAQQPPALANMPEVGMPAAVHPAPVPSAPAPAPGGSTPSGQQHGEPVLAPLPEQRSGLAEPVQLSQQAQPPGGPGPQAPDNSARAPDSMTGAAGLPERLAPLPGQPGESGAPQPPEQVSPIVGPQDAQLGAQSPGAPAPPAAGPQVQGHPGRLDPRRPGRLGQEQPGRLEQRQPGPMDPGQPGRLGQAQPGRMGESRPRPMASPGNVGAPEQVAQHGQAPVAVPANAAGLGGLPQRFATPPGHAGVPRVTEQHTQASAGRGQEPPAPHGVPSMPAMQATQPVYQAAPPASADYPAASQQGMYGQGPAGVRQAMPGPSGGPPPPVGAPPIQPRPAASPGREFHEASHQYGPAGQYPSPPPDPVAAAQQFAGMPAGHGDAGIQGPGYMPHQEPSSGPQPGRAPHAPTQPPVISLAEAVQAAHGEGFSFGQTVARDAPALWLEAVLARKPRMPSDLEARLLQDSALPIDSLLHDEVRHALRRGFWDALERSRH